MARSGPTIQESTLEKEKKMNKDDLEYLAQMLRWYRDTEKPGDKLRLACTMVIDSIAVHPLLKDKT